MVEWQKEIEEVVRQRMNAYYAEREKETIDDKIRILAGITSCIL